MVCPVKTDTRYAYNAENGSCYDSCNSSPRSNSTVPAYFQKRGMPFFPGIVTVSITIRNKGHTVFLFILTVRVRRFFTFVFSFSCKLLISNGQPPSLAPLSRHARRSALAKAGSDMASFADAQS